MNRPSDKIMFEIYRVAGGRRYRVVYFTELGGHNREREIDRAMAGDHVYDGFVLSRVAGRAKQVIGGVGDRLNAGERIAPAELEALLAPLAWAS